MGAGKKYFIQEHLQRTNVFHGGIGNVDIERVLISEGYEPITFPGHYDFSMLTKAKRLAYLLKQLTLLPAYATIVFQHPLYAGMHQLFIRLLVNLRPSIRIICFITDIDGLRDDDRQLLNTEIKFFKRFKYFIVHNASMEKWLKNIIPDAETAQLEFFDFLSPPHKMPREKSPVIVYAGNIQHSEFVYQLHQIENVSFHVYSELEPEKTTASSKVFIQKIVEPHILTKTIEGSFGLVWNGNSIHDLSGPTGHYLQLISSHKLSSYIISGLPVITHTKAAAAELVKKNQIGFTVDSLENISARINAITDDEYRVMRNNCQKLSEKISTGNFLATALKVFEK